ncbi:PLP-dependent aminotransferase family protein [Clostridium thermarum]|uniref:MocR-like pyridoxine biosynthesis transcription factor PdxR n=1 Tax=Clostridium thermarum TaxID=1716543 RepID=UPI0013D38304|nr:PLP-dependent aminotransferase family protein [Clostridium thermarum]
MSYINIKIKDNEIPKYIQIYHQIKRMVEANKLKDGEKLPTIRVLCEQLKVNKATVISAYRKLEEEGYVAQKIGSGTFVRKNDGYKNIKKKYSDVLKKINPDTLKEYIDFTGETTSSSFFPVNIFKDVINRVLERDGAEALVYQELLGFQGLRKSIVKNFWDDTVNIEDVLIVSGAQQGLDIVSKALINHKDGIVIEKPTYSGALAVFNWRKAEIIEVEIQTDGIDIKKLENIIKKNNIKFLYLMSYFQNPTGATYSHEKKKQILRLAEIYDFYIIEDDYLSELIYDSHINYMSFKKMDTGQRVIYIKSFSKVFLPGIRIGYVIAPPEFRENIQNAKINTDIATSSLMQRALELYISSGYWKSYIDQLNDIYKKRYLYMISSLEKYLANYVNFEYPGGGLNFYFRLKEDVTINSYELFEECREAKVLITPGEIFYRSIADGNRYFRIGFSQTSENEIEVGLKRISDILNNYRK